MFDRAVTIYPFINHQLILEHREEAARKRVMQHFMEVKAWRCRGSREKGEPTRTEGRDYQGKVLTETRKGQDRGTRRHTLSRRCPKVQGPRVEGKGEASSMKGK